MAHLIKDESLTHLMQSIMADHGASVSRSQILTAAAAAGIEDKMIYKHICKPEFRTAKRGHYNIAKILGDEPVSAPAADQPPSPIIQRRAIETKTLEMAPMHSHVLDEATYIPHIDPFYVRWGHHSTLEKIIKSEQFFPVYVAGPSGNGKTIMVEQLCAKLKRKFIRVNLSPETDEDDLIGGFRLQDGDTVFAKGPVIRAMEEGAVLLLDEIDRATNKIMCLQSILEGNSVLLKKICQTVYPAPGFTIIATANTTGRGDEDGRYTAASLLDEAFLERFPIIVKQPFPSRTTELKIVLCSMERYNAMDEDFATKLVDWAKIIRQTFDAGGVDDVISTRRLDHTVKTYAILGNRKAAIALVTNRFAAETSEAFEELYSKIDAGEKVFTDEEIELDPMGDPRDDDGLV